MDHVQAVNTLASERYLLGEMSEKERDAFEEHYFSCADCAEDVRAGGLMQDGARAGFVGTRASITSRRATVLPMPARSRPRLSVVLPWAVAASFALLAGYQSFLTQPALVARSPLALSPATLRPASRGQEPVVAPGPGGVVTLAVDLDGATPGAVMDYELRQADGGQVASGRVPAPQSGSPLLLMLPATLATPARHYVLSVKIPGSGGLTSSDYRFTVGAP